MNIRASDFSTCVFSFPFQLIAMRATFLATFACLVGPSFSESSESGAIKSLMDEIIKSIASKAPNGASGPLRAAHAPEGVALPSNVSSIFADMIAEIEARAPAN